MPRIPTETPQVRLTKENARRLTRMIRQTRRSLTQETNVAVELYTRMGEKAKK